MADVSSKLADVLEYIKSQELPEGVYLKCCSELKKVFENQDKEIKILDEVPLNIRITMSVDTKTQYITITKMIIYDDENNKRKGKLFYTHNDIQKQTSTRHFKAQLINNLYKAKHIYINVDDINFGFKDWSEIKLYYRTIYQDTCLECKKDTDDRDYDICNGDHDIFDGNIFDYFINLHEFSRFDIYC